MMDLRDCNYVWFANIFMQMLLFHGLNTTSGASTGPRFNVNTESSPEEHEGVIIMHYISRSFIFPVVMSVLDWVCVFIRETIQRVDFATHML
jgi:hypothetical protein